MTITMKQLRVLEMSRGRLDIVLDTTRRVHKDFGVEVSAQTTRRALHRGDLGALVKNRKPYLSSKNVKHV